MKHFLVKEDANWADEFDVASFKVIKAESKEDVIKKIEKERDSEYPMSFYFGTNEDIEIQSREELEKALEIKQITDEELKVIKKFFPNITSSAFGTNAIL